MNTQGKPPQVFVAAIPEHWCQLSANESKEDWIPMELVDGVSRFSRCRKRLAAGSNATAPCKAWDYDRSTYEATIVTEVCFLLLTPLQ